MTRWRWVLGHRGIYQVSDKGFVRSLTRKVLAKGRKSFRIQHGRILRRIPSGEYYQVDLAKRNKRSKKLYIHILVCEAFHGPKPFPKAEVNHKNGVPGDDRADNLEWTTKSGNLQHAYDTGLRDRVWWGHRK